MSLMRRTVPMLALLGVGVGSLDAQIPIRQPNANPAANSPRLLVATPYTDRAADSATAVAVGAALRTRFQRVVGTTFNVITREQMNRALAEFSYPADAILNPESASRLATAMQSRIMLFTELSRGEGGRWKARARLAGLNDDAGNTLVFTQAAGQSFNDFGEAIANAFQQAAKGQNDAKACIDQVESNVNKAADAAQKALHAFPAHGLAHACLAALAKKRSPTDPAYPVQLDSAVKADSLALRMLAALADYHNARGDTAEVILKYQQMIGAAPTNRALIEQSSKVFRSFGRPDAAEEVADRGITLDSTDLTMWDLRANACVFEQKYSCAVASLEQMVALDSTKADSNFIFRITVTAGSATDTAGLRDRLLYWAKLGVARYPRNTNLLGELLQAYKAAGQPDSVLMVTDQLLAIDSTDMTSALAGIDVAVTALKWDAATRYGALVMARGDDQQKLALAAVFTNAARTLLTQTAPPADPVAAYGLLHLAVPAAGTNPQVAPLANFLMGIAGLQTAAKSDSAAAATKSCDLARKMDGMLDEAKSGLTLGQSINPAFVPNQMKAVDQYKLRTQSMIAAYCH